MKTYLKLQWNKLQLWFMIRWYGMHRIELGLWRMAKEVQQDGDTTVYVLDNSTTARVTRTRYVLEVEEKA